jgi:hypothetical protein
MFFPQEIDALLHFNGFQEAPFIHSSRKQTSGVERTTARFDACSADYPPVAPKRLCIHLAG